MYGVMDLDTANMLGFYETLDEALAVVRDTAARYGDRSPETLNLSLANHAGDPVHGPVAWGYDLVTLAQDRVQENVN